MATGSYFTSASRTDSLGFMIQPEARVRVGTQNLYGSLEVSSWTYAAYEASIGLQDANATDLGQVESLDFTHNPTFEPLESANVQQPSVYVLTGEETTLSVGLREFKPAILNMALGSGVMYALGDEYLITFGGACSLKSRPIEVSMVNIGCDAPTSPNAANGISMAVLTLYDCQVTSGLPWSEITAGEISTLDLEFSAKPVVARALGNRIGNLYYV